MAQKSLVRPLLAALVLAMVLVLATSSVGAAVRQDPGLMECTEAPAKPQLISPANNATVDPNHVVLQWSAVEGATLYSGQVCETADCGNPAAEATTDQTSIEITSDQYMGPMPYDTCAYWRVKAINDCGESSYTSSWRFCSPSTITRTPTTGPTDTPTITPTDGPSPTPTETLTPSLTPIPTETFTPSLTPTPSNTPTRTNTPVGRYIYGEVRDADTDQPIEGVVVTLYRQESGTWTQLNQKTTDSNGNYAFGFTPVQNLHRIVEADPSGYESDRVSIPAGLNATAVNANTVEFTPPSTGSVGPLVFYDRRLPTPTFTLTPTETPTETPEDAPTETPTLQATATPTATFTPQGRTVWLPMILNRLMD